MSIINSQPRIGAAGQSTGFKIERSLRFNSADSAYLNRTFSTPTSNTSWSWSCWLKRSTLSATTFLLGTSSDCGFGFTSGDALRLWDNAGSTVATSTAVFRDPSAWYHIVFVSNGTTIKGYVNNAEYLSYTGTVTNLNSAAAHNIGRDPTGGGTFYLGGYLADVYFIDGSAKTPSDFGETDTDTGVWKPKAYSGSYGTNGFYLKFADNSGTTSTTLGKDSSGNGNNWTPNNFSVTAGAGNDSLVDTPTPYGTDTGAGGEVRGNYATLNPTIPPLTSQATTVISNGNLDFSVTQQNGSFGAAFSTIGVSSGKWYFEYLATNIRTSTYVGFFNSGNFAGFNGGTYGIGAPSDAYARTYAGQIINNNGVLVSGLSTFTDGNIVMCAVDFDAGKMWFGVNGTWDSSGNPGAGTNQTASFTPGGKTYVFAVSGYANTGVGVVNGTANFGQRPFAYTSPSGFKALCTQNLPTPTIGATSATQAGKYFNTVLYTGTGITNSVTGVGFQPDFTWIKQRNSTEPHVLSDVVRGSTKALYSNTTGAEETEGPNSFDSDGFTLGSGWYVNRNTYTYVAWNWKANGAGSSNTAGTITSTVSANTTAGFSIVTYTGNGTSGATVGHGLNATPRMMIFKQRSGTTSWPVYHASLTSANYALFLNLSIAEDGPNAAYFNNTAPSSTLFTLGNLAGINGNGNTFVAYCFAPVAGYSAFGSYTGNGSADGPMVFTGFRPAWVLVKPSSTTGDWLLYDNKRNAYNVVNNILYPNLSDAEATSGGGATLDFVSNGFKLRGAGAGFNNSGATFIYAAFAENPFKYSLAR